MPTSLLTVLDHLRLKACLKCHSILILRQLEEMKPHQKCHKQLIQNHSLFRVIRSQKNQSLLNLVTLLQALKHKWRNLEFWRKKKGDKTQMSHRNSQHRKFLPNHQALFNKLIDNLKNQLLCRNNLQKLVIIYLLKNQEQSLPNHKIWLSSTSHKLRWNCNLLKEKEYHLLPKSFQLAIKLHLRNH